MRIWRPACGGTAAFLGWAGPRGKGPGLARRARGAAVRRGKGNPALPGAQFPAQRWADTGKLPGRCLGSPARAGSGGWPPPAPVPLSPFRASSGLSLGSRFPRSKWFRSSPPGAAVNHPLLPHTPHRTPSWPLSGARAGARGRREAQGWARGHPRPAAAAGSAASGAAAGVKRRESINQPTPPSLRPGAPPAGPALCLARLPARGLRGRARPRRGPRGAARSYQGPRWPESRSTQSHPVTGTIQAYDNSVAPLAPSFDHSLVASNRVRPTLLNLSWQLEPPTLSSPKTRVARVMEINPQQPDTQSVSLSRPQFLVCKMKRLLGSALFAQL